MAMKSKNQIKPLKILIVEDEAIIGMALAADLEDSGYEVAEVAGSGEEALETIKKQPVDLLLLDIKLGNSMSGIETLKKIREIANPAVIIISGNSETKTFQQIQDLKVDGFLVKPVNLLDLQELLHSVQERQEE